MTFPPCPFVVKTNAERAGGFFALGGVEAASGYISLWCIAGNWYRTSEGARARRFSPLDSRLRRFSHLTQRQTRSVQSCLSIAPVGHVHNGPPSALVMANPLAPLLATL